MTEKSARQLGGERRLFLKAIGGISFFTFFNELGVNPLGSNTFENELTNTEAEMDWRGFEEIITMYGMSLDGLHDLAIRITNERIEYGSLFGDGNHVEVAEDAMGKRTITVAGEVILEYVQTQMQDKFRNDLEYAGHQLPSMIFSHAVLLGWGRFAVASGEMAEQEMLDRTTKYFNDGFNGTAKPFVDMVVKLPSIDFKKGWA